MRTVGVQAFYCCCFEEGCVKFSKKVVRIRFVGGGGTAKQGESLPHTLTLGRRNRNCDFVILYTRLGQLNKYLTVLGGMNDTIYS
jgi:hypothetical protein